MSPRALGHATLAVLNALADGHRYGFDIIDRTGLPSGTVYPALGALSRRDLATSAWEDAAKAHAEGRPRRRYHEITREGTAALKAARVRLNRLGLGGPRGVRPEEAS
jgi:DNA-binding PadR family transcriptional regulator